jgi:hypothetical protein
LAKNIQQYPFESKNRWIEVDFSTTIPEMTSKSRISSRFFNQNRWLFDAGTEEAAGRAKPLLMRPAVCVFKVFLRSTFV